MCDISFLDPMSHFRIFKDTNFLFNAFEEVLTLGLTQWNLNSFEFKFDDTRLSSLYKNKIGPIKKKCCILTLQFSWDSQQGRNLATSGRNKKNSIGPILFLYYEESLVSSNLNSKLFRFHCVRPNLHFYFRSVYVSKFLHISNSRTKPPGLDL